MWSLIQPVGNPNGRFDCDVAIGYPDVGRQRGGAVFYPNPEVIELPLAMMFVLLLVPFLLPAKLFQLADTVWQQEVRRQAVFFIHLLGLQGRRRQWDLLRKLEGRQGCC